MTPSAPGSTRTPIIIAIAVVIIAGSAFLLFARIGDNKPDSNQNATSNANTTGNVNTTPVGWTTYSDSEFDFSFAYPPDWKLTTYPDGTLSVTPARFQEPVPFLKSVVGDATAAVRWLNENRKEGGDETYQKTGEANSVASRSGDVYRLGGNRYAVVPFDSFTAIVYMNVLSQDVPFADYFYEYGQILASFRK